MVDKLKLLAASLLVIVALVAFYYFADSSQLLRVAGLLLAVAVAAGIAYPTGPGQAAVQFIRGADIERRRVVWPSRRETMQGTLVVIAMVVLIGVYIWIVDSLSFWAVYDVVLRTRGT